MIVVVGAGVAGLSCARAAAERGAEVVLVTPGSLLGGSDGVAGVGGVAGVAGREVAADALGGGNTALAQGGIAAVVGPGDTEAAHLADTLGAGAGLVDPEAAAELVSRGARAVRALIGAGFSVDRDPSGAISLGLEGAHTRPRIVHAGEDRTGKALHSFLLSELLTGPVSSRIRVMERSWVESLTVSGGAVSGVVLRRGDRAEGGPTERLAADAVVLATGGFSSLFPRSTNHSGARGEGIVLAARAGALVADLEFVQFHPTVLDGTGHLISEALRGAGALLLDPSGRRFMADADPRAELAPRDVVSREIHRVMRAHGGSPVLLDATGIEASGGRGTLARRFPSITAAVVARGLEWAREPIPVSPAAHYTMGGVLSDLDGRSTVPGLFVAGEVAATGVHGANRLASNSLLEGLVFGAAAGAAASEFAGSAPAARGWIPRGGSFERLAAEAQVTALLPAPQAAALVQARFDSGAAVSDPASRVAAALAEGLGIERDAAGIAGAARAVRAERGSAAALAAMALDAALSRAESRGAHQRSDFPAEDPSSARRRARVPRFVAELEAAAPDGQDTGSLRLSVHSHLPEAARAGAGRSLSSC